MIFTRVDFVNVDWELHCRRAVGFIGWLGRLVRASYTYALHQEPKHCGKNEIENQPQNTHLGTKYRSLPDTEGACFTPKTKKHVRASIPQTVTHTRDNHRA